MKRILASLGAGVVLVGALVSPALAAKPLEHTKYPPFTVTFNAPAGAFCDFAFRQTFTEQDTVTVFSDGRVRTRLKTTDTNWNLDTGFSLTERVTFQFMDYPDGTERQSGLFWHLRDADGKVHVVRAGMIKLDADFNMVKFTPNSGPDIAEVLCTALGGAPA